MSLFALPLVGCGNSGDSGAGAGHNQTVLAEVVMGDWALEGVTDAELFTTLGGGDEANIADYALEAGATVGIGNIGFTLDGGEGTYQFLKTDGTGVESVELTYDFMDGAVNHVDPIAVAVGAGGGDQVLLYDSTCDTMLAPADVDGDGELDYTAVLQRVVPTLIVGDFDHTAALGTWTAEDESTLDIKADGSVVIGIVRLAEFEGSIIDATADEMSFVCQAPNDAPVEFTFEPASGKLTVANSEWDLLENGTEFVFSK